ncbi:hypothetical protein JTE90_014461 [Oedothorax gibbosus]|uniref:Uncharacterized protein n=1 Tax=Oedothorax gibbosus TaxID=931172 RepID=A0AAV6VIU2_9ARAC|nr:hypothetical protein JTE90_014461 [Oedothorax gibbosus]
MIGEALIQRQKPMALVLPLMAGSSLIGVALIQRPVAYGTSPTPSRGDVAWAAAQTKWQVTSMIGEALIQRQKPMALVLPLMAGSSLIGVALIQRPVAYGTSPTPSRGDVAWAAAQTKVIFRC